MADTDDTRLNGLLRAYIDEHYRYGSLREMFLNLRSYDFMPRDDAECAEQVRLLVDYYLALKQALHEQRRTDNGNQ